jgi:5-methylcytosine-specific restriction endonuclease McrA
VNYDNEQELIFLSPSVNFNRRVKTTSSRSVLNGYQKGKCFYCGCDIDIHETRANKATACDVDHFFAFSLVKSPNSIFTKYEYSSFSINNIWNLVLSCKKCNSSKSNHLPEEKFLQKLHRRNEYYIQSDRPVGKTIRHHTGRETKARWQFLSYCYERVKTTPNPSFNSSWKPAYEYDRPF